MRGSNRWSSERNIKLVRVLPSRDRGRRSQFPTPTFVASCYNPTELMSHKAEAGGLHCHDWLRLSNPSKLDCLDLHNHSNLRSPKAWHVSGVLVSTTHPYFLLFDDAKVDSPNAAFLRNSDLFQKNQFSERLPPKRFVLHYHFIDLWPSSTSS